MSVYNNSGSNSEMPVNPDNFNTVIHGKKVGLFYIGNKTIKVAITNYGAKIVGIWVPDKKGSPGDVNIGYRSIEDYLNSNELYYGAIVGRYANRIARGKFTLNQREYTLPLNNGSNHLHGGPAGFSQQVWELIEHKENSLILSYFSKDGEEGYPGNLDVKVTISVGEDNALNFDFSATTDKTTVVNLTNHCFFNLAGENCPIKDHFLKINSSHYTPVDAELIPTGLIEPVENTPFNFRTSRKIGLYIDNEHAQIKLGKGFDHNFVLKAKPQKEKFLAAEVFEPVTGRILEVWTTEPGLQFYSGNFMNGSDIGKYGNPLNFRTAFCLETQHFPDSPNQVSFPSTILNPGQLYQTSTSYVFKIRT
jgi:aldose 1-epimerase